MLLSRIPFYVCVCVCECQNLSSIVRLCLDMCCVLYVWSFNYPPNSPGSDIKMSSFYTMIYLTLLKATIPLYIRTSRSFKPFKYTHLLLFINVPGRMKRQYISTLYNLLSQTFKAKKIFPERERDGEGEYNAVLFLLIWLILEDASKQTWHYDWQN